RFFNQVPVHLDRQRDASAVLRGCGEEVLAGERNVRLTCVDVEVLVAGEQGVVRVLQFLPGQRLEISLLRHSLEMVHNVARVERETREAGREEPVNICGGLHAVGVSSRAPFATDLDRYKGRLGDSGTRVP